MLKVNQQHLQPFSSKEITLICPHFNYINTMIKTTIIVFTFLILFTLVSIVITALQELLK
jgi:hypothetical protein